MTPMSADGMELNPAAVPALAKHLTDTGSHGIWLNGTSAEYASLTLSEKKASIDAWMATDEVKSGKLRLISHVGSNSLVECIELAKYSASKNVDAVAVICPSYFKPSNEQQIADWIVAVARSIPSTPFFYYHIPRFTGVDGQVHRILSLAREASPNVVGCKFTDNRFDDVNLCVSKGFNVLVGADTMLVGSLLHGAHGSVPIGCHFAG